LNGSAPLTPENFVQLFAPFDLGGTRVALAVSGGPDSMAMAWGTKEALGPDKIRAFIVDHGLRTESGEEAAEVQKNLTALGIKADILRWKHEKIDSRLHVLAREARYALLLDACQKEKINSLMLAHHSDDQAETILMRLAKGSGPAGLAGMKDETLRGSIRILRPFLEASKAQLVATCKAHSVPFVLDPSNESDHYARGRLRRVEESLAQEGFTKERLLDLGHRAREAAEAITYYAKAFLQESAKPTYDGAIELDREALQKCPQATALKVFSLILQTLHKKDFPPKRAALLHLLSFLLDEDKRGASTLQGCLVQKRKDHLLFFREPSAVVDIKPITPNQSLIWEGRWHVHYDGDEKNLNVRALGFQTRVLLDQIAPDLRKKVPWGRVRAGLPALWRGEKLVAIPSFFCDFGGLFKSASDPRQN